MRVAVAWPCPREDEDDRHGRLVGPDTARGQGDRLEEVPHHDGEEDHGEAYLRPEHQGDGEGGEDIGQPDDDGETREAEDRIRG